MTALPVRRRRRTVVAALASVAAMVLVGALFVVGVITLSNSREGEAVGVDDRPVVQLPATPNGVLAITGDDGRLASVVVATLLPDGRGGSLVPVPVDATVTSGGDGDRMGLREVVDAAAPESVRAELEAMLTLTLERIQVVEASGVGALLPPFTTVERPAATDVGVDTGDDTAPVQIPAPATPSLDRGDVVQALTTSEPDADAEARYRSDVAIWTAVAGVAPVTGPSAITVPVDDDGRPVPPTTMDELLERLWAGPVGVRGLATAPAGDATPGEPASTPLTIDRVDATLVFAQISPALVSTPNVGPTMRVEVGFDDVQLDEFDDIDGDRAALAYGVVGRLLFVQANVVSVDTSTSAAPAITVVEVADERLVEESERAGPLLFGEVEVRVAERRLDGVDVVVTLGESYAEFDAERGGGLDEADGSGGGSGTADGAGPDGTVVDDE